MKGYLMSKARTNTSTLPAITPAIPEPTRSEANTKFADASYETQHKRLVSAVNEVAQLQKANHALRLENLKIKSTLGRDRRNAARINNALGKYSALCEQIITSQREAWTQLHADLIPCALPKVLR